MDLNEKRTKKKTVFHSLSKISSDKKFISDLLSNKVICKLNDESFKKIITEKFFNEKQVSI